MTVEVASATAGITCAPEQSLFAVQPTGAFYRYPFDDVSSTVSPALAGPRASVGAGWQQFGRVLGGPSGLVYGLKAEGLFEYHWTGTAFSGAPRNITTTFNAFASGTNRNRITMDESGAVYAVTGTGLDSLYRYIIDPVQGSIASVQLMDAGGWNSFNMIFAAGDGVIYSRDSAGALYRTRFEPGSHRKIESIKQVGTGWNQFSMITSLGADILLAAKPDGTLLHYRYDETTSEWPIVARQIGTGWNQFSELSGLIDACKLDASHAPAPVSLSAEPGAPIAILPNPNGQQIDYAYVDSNTGRLAWGHQRDVNNFQTTVWPSPPTTTSSFAGVPALLTHGAEQLGIVAQRDDGHFSSTYQGSATSEVLQPWRSEGGVMASNASVVKDTNPGVIPGPVASLLAVDSNGALWRSQIGASTFFEAWSTVGDDELTGPSSTVAWFQNTNLAVARTAAGGLVGLSDSNADFPQPPKRFDLEGDLTTTGRVSLIDVGGRAYVFARDDSGTISTRRVAYSSGKGLELSAWSPVGGGAVMMGGSPAAALLPDGRIAVAARGTDGLLYISIAPSAADPIFSDWSAISTLRFAGDPTLFTYTSQSGPGWALVSYTQDYQVNAFTPSGPPSAPAGSSRASITAGFDRHVLKESN